MTEQDAPTTCLCGAKLEEREDCCSFFECGGRYCRKHRGGTNDKGWDFDDSTCEGDRIDVQADLQAQVQRIQPIFDYVMGASDQTLRDFDPLLLDLRNEALGLSAPADDDPQAVEDDRPCPRCKGTGEIIDMRDGSYYGADLCHFCKATGKRSVAVKVRQEQLAQQQQKER